MPLKFGSPRSPRAPEAVGAIKRGRVEVSAIPYFDRVHQAELSWRAPKTERERERESKKRERERESVCSIEERERGLEDLLIASAAL